MKRSLALLLILMAIHGPARTEFVEIRGDQLLLGGAIFKLKGVNYYPRNHYWQKMWPEWDPDQIRYELDLLRDLGGNSLRILLPFDHGWTDAQGNANPVYLNRLDALLGWATERGMRSIVTLFDWRTTWAAAGSPEETRDLRYLSDIVTRFRNDPRVLLWDVKNEPDNPGYGGWDDVPANYPKIDWLERMCLAIKSLDSNHPVGVGMTTYTSCYYGINGKSVHSFTDVVLFHNYNGPDTVRQIGDLKAWGMQHGVRPIILEETGWPTNPAYHPDFTEARQLGLYQDVTSAMNGTGISGLIAWVLVDFDPGVGNTDDWYGILRKDYSRKPAADVFQNQFSVAPFPTPVPTPFQVRVDLGPTDVSWGLRRVEVSFDGKTEAFADVAGRPCRKPRTDLSSYYIYFALDGVSLPEPPAPLFVEVDYLAGGGGLWRLEYDGTSNPYTVTESVSVGTGTVRWETRVFRIDDALFAKRQNGSSDFRLNCLSMADGGYEDWFARVRVFQEGPTPTPTPVPAPAHHLIVR